MLKGPSSDSLRAHRPPFLYRVVAALLTLTFLSPPYLIASGPEWWRHRGVLRRDISTGEAVAPDDYAAINQGQLKNLAAAARDELQRLPGGSGAVANAMVEGWATPSSSTDDYAAVNLGQLKSVARPFLDNLRNAGLLQAYPWEGKQADDFALANIGQAKNVFSFDLDADADLDGLSNLHELHLGSDPLDRRSTGANSSLITNTHGLVPIFFNPADGKSPKVDVSASGGGGTSVPPKMGAPARYRGTGGTKFTVEMSTDGSRDENGLSTYDDEQAWRAHLVLDPTNGAENATQFRIEQRKGDLSVWEPVVTLERADFAAAGYKWTSGNLSAGCRYQFRVYAINPDGEVLIVKTEVHPTPAALGYNTFPKGAVIVDGDGNRKYKYRLLHPFAEDAHYNYSLFFYDDNGSVIKREDKSLKLNGWWSDPFTVSVPHDAGSAVPDFIADVMIVPNADTAHGQMGGEPREEYWPARGAGRR